MDPVVRWCSQALRQSPRPRHLRKRTRSQGPSLHRNYPVSSVICPCPTPARTAAFRDVEAATLAHDGSPPITRPTFPTCRAHYPGGSNGCACRLLPRSYSLPQMAGGSASALSLSRPAQALLTLRPTGSLSRPRRPLSRGSSPSGYPAEPPVSYQINRQLSGWIPPPQVIRAFGAHGQAETLRPGASHCGIYSALIISSLVDLRLLVQNHVQQGTVDFNLAVVINKTQFPKSVHEKAHARSRRADHLRQCLLADFRYDWLRPTFLAKI